MGFRAIFSAFLLIGLGGCLATLQEGPIGERGGSYNRQAWGVPFQKDGVRDGQLLEAHVYFPKSGDGPFPLIVFSHGSPRGSFRPTVFYDAQAKWFTERGYAVVLPMRRGYGRSHGDWSEDYGSCYNSDYVKAGLATSDDILAAVAYFARQGFVDPARVVLVGQSAGGLGSAAAASRNPPGVIGFVNFSGGRGSRSSGSNCSPERLVEATGHFGKTTTMPSIWIYGSDDDYFGPKLSRAMYRAFDEASDSDSRFHLFDGLGHSIFSRDRHIEAWGPLVADFLRRVDRR